MRRRLTTALLALALPGCIATASAGSATTVGVRASEWDLILSRPAVGPGHARISYQNAGEDPHNLRIRRKGSSRVLSIAELLPAGIDELELRLRPDSRYVMWCSTVDGEHREWGMEATLRVRKR